MFSQQEITKNYVLAKDFLNSTASAALQINTADFTSFYKTFHGVLLRLLQAIVNLHDNAQTLAEIPIICPKIEEMRVLITRLKAKEPISLFGNEFAKYFQIKPCGNIVIGEYLRPYLFIVNADCSRKTYEFNFHDICAEDFGTIFRINRRFSAKLSPRRKLVIQHKLNILNNSLDSTRKIYAKRVTNFIKENRLLCMAFNVESHPVLINPTHWGVAYCVNNACEITRVPASDAPPLFGLMFHAKGHQSDMKTAKQSEIYDFISKEHYQYPNGHPFGGKEGFIAHTKQKFANDHKKFPMITFNNAWDKFFEGEKIPGWNIKPKAKIDQKKSISPT